MRADWDINIKQNFCGWEAGRNKQGTVNMIGKE